MTERWKSYFVGHNAFGGQWLATAVAHWSFHEPLYGMIQTVCPRGAKLLDVGCGPGWSDIYLSSLGYEVTGIDNEPELVYLATKNNEQMNCNARFEVADAFDLSSLGETYDLAFSCGVLEHFDRDVTVTLLREQAKVSRYVLIEIPTKYTAYSDGITDERIYSITQLSRIVEDAGLNVVARFGYGDITATHFHLFVRRLLPRFIYRLLQNRGYAYAIAVIGQTK